MKDYYIAKGNEKIALSFDELKNEVIFSDTLIWKEGWGNWKEASEIPEIKEFIRNSPPPLVERKGNVVKSIIPSYLFDNNTMYPTIFIGLFIVLQLFYRSISLSYFGIISSTILAGLTWYSFKTYLESINDIKTGKWVTGIIGAYIITGVINIVGLGIEWHTFTWGSLLDIIIDSDSNATGELSKIYSLLNSITTVSIIAVMVIGVKILLSNKNHPTSLKGIAISTIILIPIYMKFSFMEAVQEEVIVHFIIELLLLIPYYFLLNHFYKLYKKAEILNRLK